MFKENPMAFGFPAYHMEQLDRACDLDTVRQAILSRGWTIQSETEKEIRASTGLNFWSWGEKVVIERFDDGIVVTSSCALVTQCIDWGKNKSNVKKLIDEIKRMRSTPGK